MKKLCFSNKIIIAGLLVILLEGCAASKLHQYARHDVYLGDTRAELNKETSLEGVGDWGRTPLGISAWHGSERTTQLLIEHGANVDAYDDKGQSPLNLASQNGHINIVKSLTAAGANVNDTDNYQATPLYYAAWRGHVDVVKILIKAGAKVNDKISNGATPFTMAVINGDVAMVRSFIAAGANINDKSSGGNTALHTTSRYGHIEAAKILVAAGANINVQNDNHETPLHRALIYNQHKYVNWLVVSGVNVDKSLLLKVGHSLNKVAQIEEAKKEQKRKQIRLAKQKQQQKIRLAKQRKQQKIARKILLKKMPIIKKSIRQSGLEDEFKQYSEASEVCDYLNESERSISRLDCSDYHERVEKNCSQLKRKYERRYQNDMDDVCPVANSYQNEFNSVFGSSNSDVITAVLKDYKDNNNVSYRSFERDYPYTDLNLRDLENQYEEASESARDADYEAQPGQVNAFAKALYDGLDSISKSMPSTQETLRRHNAKMRDILIMSKQLDEPTRRSAKHKYKNPPKLSPRSKSYQRELAQVDKQASLNRQKAACDAKSGKFNRQTQNCTTIQQHNTVVVKKLPVNRVGFDHKSSSRSKTGGLNNRAKVTSLSSSSTVKACSQYKKFKGDRVLPQVHTARAKVKDKITSEWAVRNDVWVEAKNDARKTCRGITGKGNYGMIGSKADASCTKLASKTWECSIAVEYYCDCVSTHRGSAR